MPRFTYNDFEFDFSEYGYPYWVRIRGKGEETLVFTHKDIRAIAEILNLGLRYYETKEPKEV